MPRPRIPLDVRFWSHVSPGDPEACWDWQGSRTVLGYGRMKHGDTIGYAHRVSWEVHHGPIPPGLHVLHRCDRPPCVNPAHLWLGTHRDNIRDCWAKGRHPRIRRPQKLTAEQAQEIRRLGGTMPQRQLGALFGVSQVMVNHILAGRAWR